VDWVTDGRQPDNPGLEADPTQGCGNIGDFAAKIERLEAGRKMMFFAFLTRLLRLDPNISYQTKC